MITTTMTVGITIKMPVLPTTTTMAIIDMTMTNDNGNFNVDNRSLVGNLRIAGMTDATVQLMQAIAAASRRAATSTCQWC